MTELFESGHVVDAIVALIALEALLLVVIRRRTGLGIALPALVWNLLAGCALLLALRAALVGAAWPWIAVWLGAAFVMHVADLWVRAQPRRATSRASPVLP